MSELCGDVSMLLGELRRAGGRYIRDERRGQTLEPTALVHEAFLRLVDQDHADWRNRVQCVGVAAQIMRRLLVDRARQARIVELRYFDGLSVEETAEARTA